MNTPATQTLSSQRILTILISDHRNIHLLQHCLQLTLASPRVLTPASDPALDSGELLVRLGQTHWRHLDTMIIYWMVKINSAESP